MLRFCSPFCKLPFQFALVECPKRRAQVLRSAKAEADAAAGYGETVMYQLTIFTAGDYRLPARWSGARITTQIEAMSDMPEIGGRQPISVKVEAGKSY